MVIKIKLKLKQTESKPMTVNKEEIKQNSIRNINVNISS